MVAFEAGGEPNVYCREERGGEEIKVTEMVAPGAGVSRLHSKLFLTKMTLKDGSRIVYRRVLTYVNIALNTTWELIARFEWSGCFYLQILITL